MNRCSKVIVERDVSDGEGYFLKPIVRLGNEHLAFLNVDGPITDFSDWTHNDFQHFYIKSMGHIIGAGDSNKTLDHFLNCNTYHFSYTLWFIMINLI